MRNIIPTQNSTIYVNNIKFTKNYETFREGKVMNFVY